MITCCELALGIALGAFALILALLAMFFNYNLKLDARTVKLEKKNGREMQSITELLNKSEYERREIEKLSREVKELKKKVNG